jgi:ABC-2 type transport system permease protein
MNATIAQLTLRNLLGRRRALLLLALPIVLLGLSLIVRLSVNEDSRGDVVIGLLGAFALGTIIPLLGLIAGTGAIGPEIDDGSIVYLLAKPINRHSIVVSKLVVAIGVVSVFGGLPVFVSGIILIGRVDRLWLAYGVGALIAGAAYSALFLLLGVITRNAVVVGLIYALVWESVVGNFVPGAQALSIQQWSLAVTRVIVGKKRADLYDIAAAVRPEIAVPLLVVVTVVATWFAGSRLRSLRLAGDE